MVLTPRGQSFIDEPLGEAVALVDGQEGILKILMIAAEKGTGHRADFLEDWAEYLARHSRYGTDSTIKDTLSRRLQSILKRGYSPKQAQLIALQMKDLPICVEQTVLKAVIPLVNCKRFCN